MKRWTKNQERELIQGYDGWLNDFCEYIETYKYNLIKCAREQYGKTDIILTPKEMADDGFLHNLWKYKWEQEQARKPVKEAQQILDGIDTNIEIKPFSNL